MFCDESHPMKHDGLDFFVIGCAYCPTEDVETHESAIADLKKRNGYDPNYEIKWSRINGKNAHMAAEIIAYVRSAKNLNVRIVVATNKDEKQFAFFLKHEDFYERMYVLLVKKAFLFSDTASAKTLDLAIDRRNTHSEEEAKRICKDIYFSGETKLINFKPKIVDSKNKQLIQAIDILLGATSYERQGLSGIEPKLSTIKAIKSSFGLRSLSVTTALRAEKYNVFVWSGAKNALPIFPAV
jgi:hypothetical protein